MSEELSCKNEPKNGLRGKPTKMHKRHKELVKLPWSMLDPCLCAQKAMLQTQKVQRPRGLLHFLYLLMERFSGPSIRVRIHRYQCWSASVRMAARASCCCSSESRDHARNIGHSESWPVRQPSCQGCLHESSGELQGGLMLARYSIVWSSVAICVNDRGSRSLSRL